MKRLLVSLTVLTVVLSIFGYGLYGVDTAYSKISEQLGLAVEFSEKGDPEEAKRCSEKAQEIYSGYDLFFHGFVSRKTVEDVGKTLSQLPPLAKKDSLPEFSSKCEEAKKILQHLKEAQSINVKNMF